MKYKGKIQPLAFWISKTDTISMVLGSRSLRAWITLFAVPGWILSTAGCFSNAFEEPGPGSNQTSSPPPDPVSVTGLTSSSTRVKAKTWNWGCAAASACTYRFVIDQTSNTIPSGSFSSIATASQTSGNGFWYLHVQAQDTDGLLSSVKHVYAQLDNTAPTLTGLTNDTTATLPKVWSWGCNESPCSYRYVIDQSANTNPSGNYSSVNTVTHSGSAGTWYIHVQAKDSAGNETSVSHVSAVLGGSFTLSGTARYDWIPADDSSAVGGIRLNISDKQARAIRRARVEAISAANSSIVLASGTTNDLGAFSLNVPNGSNARIRVYAHLYTTQSTRDSISPDKCLGASWDIRVVDNTTAGSPLYGYTSTFQYSVATAAIDLYAQTTRNASNYTSRAGAPFALLDTFVTQLELVCQGEEDTFFPQLFVNWSPNNIVSSTMNVSSGNIVTSHFTTNTQGVPQLYILGKEDNDTDEYDDHVVAHEFGHYLEHALYRSDSIGGAHTLYDSLDPRVAFGEGFGNAISAMTFNDPIYVDTSGSNESTGFQINVDTAPVETASITDRSVFSELAIQHFLWKLFSDFRSVDSTAAYSRIHTVLSQDQRNTPAFTSIHSFSSYYYSRFGGSALGSDTALGLSNLWANILSSPLQALCLGACSGSGQTPDLFDTDGDLGSHYASFLRYKASGGSLRSAAFWNLYPRLQSGANTSGHNVTNNGGYPNDVSLNKMGMSRWYRYTHSGADRNVTVSVPSIPGVNCSTDALNMAVYFMGQVLDEDFSSSGCPSVTFPAINGETYIVDIRGHSGNTSNFTVQVSP